MYKAFALFGVTSLLFVAPGCGGKKEVASVPPHLAQASGGPSTTKSGEGDSSAGYNPNPPSAGKLGPPDDSAGGGYNPPQGQGPGGGPMAMEMDSGGGSSGSGGYGGPQSGSSKGYGGPETGSDSPGYGGPQGYNGPQSSGGPQGNPNGQPSGPQGQGARNQNRAVAPKPLTLKEQSVLAFQLGNPKRAYTLMQAHALHIPDDEAIEVLKEYRWAAHRKRPQLGVNVAVGVSLKNTSNGSDLSPIGSESRNGMGGGSMEYGMSPSGGMAGAANAAKSKTFAETTGALGSTLASSFKESHSKGNWSPAFKDYSLGAPRGGSFGGSNASFAGGGFGGNGPGGSSGFEGSGSEPNYGAGPSAGFQEGEGNPNGGNPNGGYPSGYGQQAGNSGGGFGPGAPGGGPPSDASGPSANNPGAGLKGKGGSMASPLKFLQGKGGFGGMLEEGGSGYGGYGGPAGMAGPGGQGFGGPGTAAVGGANSKLPAGSTPIAPCLIYIGVDEMPKLVKKAAQEGYDALIVFDVKVGLNRMIGKVTNDTYISVVQPNLVPKEVKKICSTSILNNIQAAKNTAKGDSDGVEEVIKKVMKGTEEALALQSIPTILTTEMIMNKRIPALVKDTESSVIERLSEVNLYFSKGLIDDSQKADAFEQIDGASGKVIATGSPSEKLAAIEKLLEREFK